MLKRNLTIAILLATAQLLAVSTASSEEWIRLFDGKSLEGWSPNENPETWVIEDGAIVTRGARSHLFYSGDVAGGQFRNFVFEAEVQTDPGSNSGIYIHTEFQPEGWPAKGYECQIINSPPETPEGKYIERKMTGSIYAIRNTWQAPVENSVWFKYRIQVVGKTIRTFVNGRLICAYTEGENPFRPEGIEGRLLGTGTFALQGHDPDSVVRFRNIRVKLLPDDLLAPVQPERDAELDRLITKLSKSNHPLIDIGIETPSHSFAADQAKDSMRFGITIIEPDLSEAPAKLLIVNDRSSAPDVDALKAAKAAGMKIAFSSGGATELDPGRIRARLQAIEAAELAWSDLWVPGQ